MTTLTMKEEKRLEIIQRVFRGELTVMEAALVLGVTERHCYRVKARIAEQGAKGDSSPEGQVLQSNIFTYIGKISVSTWDDCVLKFDLFDAIRQV